MKYKYSVIGDNTQENREWLEKVGYKFTLDNIDILDVIITSKSGFAYLLAKEHLDDNDVKERLKDCINCIGNPPLFKAISALREDSDYMQWFTDGDSWSLCADDNYLRWCMENAPFQHPDIHKATLTELQERFKL